MTKDMARDLKDTATLTNTRAISKQVRPMEKESIIGQMEKSTMENGARESKRDMECGKEYMETAIWANGVSPKPMVMEFISGKTEIVMKAVGTSALNMGKEVTFLQMVTLILVSIKMDDQMEKEFINGRMAVFILETSKMA